MIYIMLWYEKVVFCHFLMYKRQNGLKMTPKPKNNYRSLNHRLWAFQWYISWYDLKKLIFGCTSFKNSSKSGPVVQRAFIFTINLWLILIRSQKHLCDLHSWLLTVTEDCDGKHDIRQLSRYLLYTLLSSANFVCAGQKYVIKNLGSRRVHFR